MPALIVLFNLRDGVDPAEYEAWARETDIPGVKGLRSVDEFRVFRTTGLLGSDAPPPYSYVELIEINDLDAFGEDAQGETVARTAAEFARFADAPVFMFAEQAA